MIPRKPTIFSGTRVDDDPESPVTLLKVELGNGSGYEPSSEEFKQALRDGYRYIVFSEPNISWYETVNIDDIIPANGYLVLEGGGYYQVNINRKFSGGPFIKTTRAWYITMRGLTFQGHRDLYPNDTSPLVWFRHIDGSVFEDNVFRNSGGPGMMVGDSLVHNESAQVSNSSWVRNIITDNGGPGIAVYNGIDLHFDRNTIERNGTNTQGQGAARVAGIEWHGPAQDFTPSSSYTNRGGGTITRNHYELAGINGDWGIALYNVRYIRISDNYNYLSNVLLDSTTEGITVAQNRLFESEVRDFGKNNRVCGNYRQDF